MNTWELLLEVLLCFNPARGKQMLMNDSQCPRQCAQPQALFTECAELKLLVFTGVLVGGAFYFILMAEFNQECAKIAQNQLNVIKQKLLA